MAVMGCSVTTTVGMVLMIGMALRMTVIMAMIMAVMCKRGGPRKKRERACGDHRRADAGKWNMLKDHLWLHE